MLRNVKLLNGSAIHATDGTVGHLKDIYFDDASWVIRYLIVNPGSWLADRKVLISPYGVVVPHAQGHVINVSMSREQVKNSPDIQTHKPISRQSELSYLDYYGYPTYWTGGGLWGAGAYPSLPALSLSGYADRRERRDLEPNLEDTHLRSASEVIGYHVHASDDDIGHVEDFLFDEQTWAIRYVVIDTRDWWPGGKRVLVATQWIDRIDWNSSKIFTSLSREAVKESAQELTTYDREFESSIHEAHDRVGYWV